jgi:carbon storage regulator CsrA
MLVLSRKLQEQICIGNQITVTILKTRGKTVRIGIEAPRDVRVTRGELATQPGCPAARPNRCPAQQNTGRHPQRWSVANMRSRVVAATRETTAANSVNEQ